jgi:hypothetical protein
MRRRAKRSFLLLLGMLAVVILLRPVHGNAQVVGATLSGSVSDPTGANIPKFVSISFADSAEEPGGSSPRASAYCMFTD